jgi:hypothetical protein
MGPTCVSALEGSPIRAPRASLMTPSTTWSWTLRWTSRREPARQVCPVAAKMPATAPLIALSMLASANTTLADLPPSSSVTDLRPAATAP